jgi:flagellar hook-associated protein 1 FlgK
MGLPNIFNTGQSGMVASKAAIATAGHNIANSKTEGFSRQRVQTETNVPHPGPGSHSMIGTGVLIARTERVNDEYIEKQIRNVGRDIAQGEEKEIVLRQTEDIFNEMGGEGLNRLISKYFNDFRKLSNDPDSEAVRQSVRESSQSLVNDFHRIHNELKEVQNHIDSRIEGSISELNQTAANIAHLNQEIQKLEISGAPANDLLDKRDMALKKLATFVDISMHYDKQGLYNVDVKGLGPIVTGVQHEAFGSQRGPADDQGKPENALDITTTATVSPNVTHRIHGGKLGALVESRDQTLSAVLSRMDDLAYAITSAVNEIHEQGYTRNGEAGVKFFKALDGKERAAELMDLSDDVRSNVNNIATAAQPDSPGDNRIAVALSGLQHQKLMGDGHVTMDDWYNSIVSDVGVTNASNRNMINQQKDIMSQLGKMREQISGVSIDEETANIMQFQQAFAANAKVIQVADELLKDVLDLRR